MMRRLEATLNAKLLCQILLLLGCVALAVGVLDVFLGRTLLFTQRGWWRAAIAAWVLLIAVRTVYPPTAK
jgi:hypothetical protein